MLFICSKKSGQSSVKNTFSNLISVFLSTLLSLLFHKPHPISLPSLNILFLGAKAPLGLASVLCEMLNPKSFKMQ